MQTNIYMQGEGGHTIKNKLFLFYSQGVQLLESSDMCKYDSNTWQTVESPSSCAKNPGDVRGENDHFIAGREWNQGNCHAPKEVTLTHGE